MHIQTSGGPRLHLQGDTGVPAATLRVKPGTASLPGQTRQVSGELRNDKGLPSSISGTVIYCVIRVPPQ
eukprot:721099-Hanusia_phi.AAC.1